MEECAGRIGTVVLSRAAGWENGGERHGALLLAHPVENLIDRPAGTDCERGNQRARRVERISVPSSGERVDWSWKCGEGEGAAMMDGKTQISSDWLDRYELVAR